jgi:hypothetical protein
MKLRIRGDSLRFRLQQGEVRTLIEEGRIEERTRFGATPEECFVYGLELSSEAVEATCSWRGSRLTLTLPRAPTREWAVSDALTFDGSQTVVGGTVLRFSVEKDLACLKPRADEDDRDAFPNPNA